MVHSFGPFRYDPEQRVLLRDGETVPLFPKAVDMLQVLLERRGQIVDKSELLRLVWPDAVVEDVGIARNISLLRKALDDGPYIETVPKRGYRFVAAETAPGPTASRWWIWLLAAGVLAVSIWAEFYRPSRFFRGSGASVAVVPFECVCSAEQASFAAGLTDVLTARLAQLRGVQVTAASTVRRHQRAGVSMGLMGRLLGLDALVEGSVQPLPGAFRVTAVLTDVHTGKIIWSEVMDEEGDPAAAESRAAAEIVEKLNRVLDGSISEGNAKRSSNANRGQMRP